MSKCPKCSAELRAIEAACPECGWDYPDAPAPGRTSWAYSGFANAALLVGMVASLILAGLTAFKALKYVLEGRWYPAILHGPLLFFLAFAMFVVFARVSDTSSRP